MTLQPGQILSHYRLVEKIGEGGMGVVWKAEDTKLDREVAIKVLPAELATDTERLARFEREAKAIASLNHPNIVTIHSIEESEHSVEAPEKVQFLTMELVSGSPLSQLIPRHGMALGQILDLGLALTEAMTAAHEKNITHRDLKPDNIMMDDSGRLKILDFGLAKLKEEIVPASPGSELPTRAVQTEDGRILGTVAYMSPEQAEGKPVDPRSDVFSMGILLYEMSTGERPFKGDTKISLISSIMRDTPTSITEINSNLPRHLGRIIKRCLVKNPYRRYGNARELYNDLLELKEEVDSGEIQPATAARPRARRKTGIYIGVGVGAGAVIVAVALVLIQFSPAPSTPSSAFLEASLTRITDRAGLELWPSFSPDGRTVIFASESSGNWDIYLQRVEGEKVVNLTEDSPEDDYQPRFSPDGERIAFRSERDGGGIFVMGGMGESVTRLTEGGFDPTWSPDEKEILYATEGAFNPRDRKVTSQLIAANVESREARVVFEGDAVQPHWSPHGHRIAYWGLPKGSGQRDIWTIPADGGEPVPVTQDSATDWNPVWSPDGRFLYFSSDRGGTFNLWRIPIEEETGEVLGEPQPVTTGAANSEHLTISGDGQRIAYLVRTASSNLQKIPFDPSTGSMTGEPLWMTQGTNLMTNLDVSPDEEWITYYLSGSQEDILLARIDGTGRRQLTNDIHKDRDPRWSPDGKRIAFHSDRSGTYEIWTIQPDGRGLQRLTDTPGQMAVVPIWSPDGSRLVFGLEERWFLLDPSLPWKEQELQPLPPWNDEDGTLYLIAWSPDGKWLSGNFFSRVDEWFRYEGFGVHSLETGEYEQLLERDEPEGRFSSLWLSDGRRLLLSNGENVFLLDRETREYREVYSAEPDSVDLKQLSKDDRTLYWLRSSDQGDIWMLTLK
jgi:Tol biopolymer transport system component